MWFHTKKIRRQVCLEPDLYVATRCHAFRSSCDVALASPMEYRTSDRGNACISSESALRELSAAVVRPAISLIFPCASWASNFCAWPSRRHPTFLLKRRSSCSNKHSVTWSFLFEASRYSTRCGKVRVQSQHRRSSLRVAVPVEANSHAHSDHVLSVHKEW